jgi:hypothetical protein
MITRFRGPNRAEAGFVLTNLAPGSCGFSVVAVIVTKPFSEVDLVGPDFPSIPAVRAKGKKPSPGSD